MEQFEYEEQFIEGGKIGLLLKHPDSSRDEVLTFENFDDMEACAIARPYIPRSIWEKLCTMMEETMAFHDPKHFV